MNAFYWMCSVEADRELVLMVEAGNFVRRIEMEEKYLIKNEIDKVESTRPLRQCRMKASHDIIMVWPK